jgi:hypothetical protein
MNEPKITITASKITAIAGVIAALSVIYGAAYSLLDMLATKDDIKQLSTKVDIGFIDLTVEKNNTDLRRYDDFKTINRKMTDEEKRIYTSLIESNKRLLSRRERLLK